MRLYNTLEGWFAEDSTGKVCRLQETLDTLLQCKDLFSLLAAKAKEATAPAVLPLPTKWIAPIASQEVWAAGVTYYRSRSARMEEAKEAGGSNFYDKVYRAERPELFFKALAARVAGPNDKVRIRKDATWSVPEPELTLLINTFGEIVGYTAGNDMSSRDIEGENPLYLPQAKVYDRSCALGPSLLISESPMSPDTEIKISIRRKQAVEFSEKITLAAMKRDPKTLVEYLYRELSFQHGCFLMTGTGIVPPDSFTLASGDVIDIAIGQIGTLSNQVE